MYDVVFYENISSTIAYTSQPYAEAMAMRPDVSYTPCATSSREQTKNITPLTWFEEGDLLSETHDNAESGEKYNDDSIMPPLSSEE